MKFRIIAVAELIDKAIPGVAILEEVFSGFRA
jgi:hypothetical protein